VIKFVSDRSVVLFPWSLAIMSTLPCWKTPTHFYNWSGYECTQKWLRLTKFMVLSTIFELYCGNQFCYDWENWSTRRKLPTCHWQTYKRDRHGRMVVGFTTICTVSSYTTNVVSSNPAQVKYLWYIMWWNLSVTCWVRVMVFSATFNNISAISWLPVLLVDETGLPIENNRPAASHW
jgi:hypothetical protein